MWEQSLPEKVVYWSLGTTERLLAWTIANMYAPAEIVTWICLRSSIEAVSMTLAAGSWLRAKLPSMPRKTA